MSGQQNSLWDTIIASNPGIWLASLGTAAGSWALALRTIRSSRLDAAKLKSDGADALRKQMSADVSDAFNRQTAEIARKDAELTRKNERIVELETECAALRADREKGWDKARAMEAWAWAFVRHEYGNLVAQIEGLFRALGWLLDNPVDPDRRDRAQRMLDARKPPEDVAVPTLADIEGKHA